MGGDIWIESELGKGAAFAFTIRVRRGAAERGSLLAPGLRLHNIRVLFVDDEAETRECFADIAEQLRIACDTAGDAGEALRRIDGGERYHLFFVDWSMPGMNGIELTREIKERDPDGSVVVMISGMEWSRIEKDARAAGADHFLSKPLFPSAVADCVNQCVGVQAYPAANAPPDSAESLSGYRILLAEDMEINREIVLAMLEPTQIGIDCALNGIQAARMFGAQPERYDMILMDVQMPEMDGLEATRCIRALGFPKAEEIPIVAMTANVFREDIRQCLDAGMNDHIGKPLDVDEVLGKIKRYLKPRTV